MVKILTVLIIAIILVTLDKGITAINIRAVEKNNPEINPYSVEKNPLARFSFEKFGLVFGTIIYWIFSVVTFLLAVWLMAYPAKVIAPGNAEGVALYLVVLIYFLVIGNNFYFWFRYNKLL